MIQQMRFLTNCSQQVVVVVVVVFFGACKSCVTCEDWLLDCQVTSFFGLLNDFSSRKFFPPDFMSSWNEYKL